VAKALQTVYWEPRQEDNTFKGCLVISFSLMVQPAERFVGKRKRFREKRERERERKKERKIERKKENLKI
jgi:hypothetical protein